MTFKVVNVSALPALPFKEGEEIIRAAGAEYVSVVCRSEEEIPAVAGDADAIIGIFTGGFLTLSSETISRLNQCKIVAIPGMGYEGVDLEAASEAGIIVVNNPDYGAEEVANHTMLLILALTKKLIPTLDAIKAGKWDSPFAIRNQVLPPIFRLSKQTLGLIGFGNIPRSLIPRARPFLSRIMAYDPYVSEEVLQNYSVEPADLNAVLSESDYVSLHAALTRENHHLMGLEQFKMMKPTAYFINTARGGLVDEKALYTALSQGIIAGAALDVMESEPPQPENPLLKLNNIIVTPHTSHYSVEADTQIRTKPSEDIVSVMNNGWPREIAFRNPQVKDKFLVRWGVK